MIVVRYIVQLETGSNCLNIGATFVYRAVTRLSNAKSRKHVIFVGEEITTIEAFVK